MSKWLGIFIGCLSIFCTVIAVPPLQRMLLLPHVWVGFLAVLAICGWPRGPYADLKTLRNHTFFPALALIITTLHQYGPRTTISGQITASKIISYTHKGTTSHEPLLCMHASDGSEYSVLCWTSPNVEVGDAVSIELRTLFWRDVAKVQFLPLNAETPARFPVNTFR